MKCLLILVLATVTITVAVPVKHTQKPEESIGHFPTSFKPSELFHFTTKRPVEAARNDGPYQYTLPLHPPPDFKGKFPQTTRPPSEQIAFKKNTFAPGSFTFKPKIDNPWKITFAPFEEKIVPPRDQTKRPKHGKHSTPPPK